MSLFNIQNLVFVMTIFPGTVAQCNTFENEFKSLKSQQVATQLQRTINDKLQQIITLEVAAGGDVTELEYALQQNSQNSHKRFGAVLSPHNQGLVLSVTPNSPASKLGLNSGDTIINVNNVSLENASFTTLMAEQYRENNNAISIKILRDHKAKYLTGEYARLIVPAWTLTMAKIVPSSAVQLDVNAEEHSAACGRIIVGKYMPQDEDSPYRAKPVIIKQIDGVKQRLGASGLGSWMGGDDARATFSQKTRFKLAAGEHKILVAPRYSKNTKHIDIRDGEKTEFMMTIAANTSYYLVYDTREDSPYSKTNTPVIWQTKPQPCEL